METNEEFSDDPLENIKIENEFLKLKLKAEYGDAFFMQSYAELPPEIENQFLKNMIAFEENYQKGDRTTVYERIGRPSFKRVKELKAPALNIALKSVTDQMAKHGIYLDICDGPYPDEVIYKFITEELFDHEIEKDRVFGIGGGTHFIYEEFYPNNRADIEKNTHEFLLHWFSRKFDEFSSELDHEFIQPGGVVLKRDELLEKIQVFFDAFEDFRNDGYNINEIKFEFPGPDLGVGHAAGMLKYDAVLENGEMIHYEGPYQLYMSCRHKWWSVMYFVMPGFVW